MSDVGKTHALGMVSIERNSQVVAEATQRYEREKARLEAKAEKAERQGKRKLQAHILRQLLVLTERYDAELKAAIDNVKLVLDETAPQVTCPCCGANVPCEPKPAE